MSSPPTSYAELATILYRLPTLVADARRARGLSMVNAAREMGVSDNTLKRLEIGAAWTPDTAMAALRWLDQT
jgi:ribosome-binding protein aMBF1 (putative translation factor)